MGSSQDVYQEMEDGTMKRIPVKHTFVGSDEYSDEVKKRIAPADEAKRRKQRPVFSGVLKYFPNALMEVAHCSYLGQQQHNPGKPLAWDRSKSGDELDALVRHLMQADEKDTDGVYHAAKVAWRALAYLEKLLEKEQ